MDGYKFGVGEYKTRGGCQAKVEFIVPKPTCAAYSLLGWIRQECGEYIPEWWQSNGTGPCTQHTLIPPVRYMWRLVHRYGSGGWYRSVAEAIEHADIGPTTTSLIGALRAVNVPPSNDPDFGQPIVYMSLEQARAAEHESR